MKPRPIVQIQSGFALASVLAALGLCGRAAALGILIASGLGALVAGYLAVRYQLLVRPVERSEHRRVRDRTMVGCLALGLILPSVIAIVVLAGGMLGSPPLESVPGRVAVIAAVAVFASMLASSCVDWYLIRPFRDGVLNEPVCRAAAHEDETALYYAQAWVAHRTVAELVGWVGSAVVLIVGLVALQQSTHDPTWSGVFTYLAPSGAVYLGIGGYLARRLRPVPQYVQEPSPGLGRWVRGTVRDKAGNNQQIEGFVVDVALGAGLQIITDGDPDRAHQHVELRHAGGLNRVTRELCADRCEHWIPQCERGLREAEQEARRLREARAAAAEEAQAPRRQGQPEYLDRRALRERGLKARRGR